MSNHKYLLAPKGKVTDPAENKGKRNDSVKWIGDKTKKKLVRKIIDQPFCKLKTEKGSQNT